MLHTAFSRLIENNPNKTELYFLGIAGWGEEEVFRRELAFIQQQFSQFFDGTDRSIFLVNSRRSVDEYPVATTSSIRRSILQLADKMDSEEDVLWIYASSHGGEDATLSLGHSGIQLNDLSAESLKEFLDESAIKHKVIVISACYSGSFIEPLKDDHTVIITSAAKDKTSFGCADDSTFTYFGKAFLKHSLAKNADFFQAFNHAKLLIDEWEKEQELGSSEPQIHSTTASQKKLELWRTDFSKHKFSH